MTPGQEIAAATLIRRALDAAAGVDVIPLRIARASNAPIPELGSAQLVLARAVDDSPAALPYTFRDDDPEATGDELVERVVSRGTVEAEVEIRTLAAAAPEALDDEAHAIASRVRALLHRERLVELLVGTGVGLLAVGDVVDVSAIVRDGEAEARASLPLVFRYAYASDSRLPVIASTSTSGTLTTDNLVELDLVVDE